MVNQVFMELNSLHVCCCAVKMLLAHAELVEWSLKLRPFFNVFSTKCKNVTFYLFSVIAHVF